jgi:predicted transcriptional regulator
MMKMAVAAVALMSTSLVGCAKSESAENVAKEMRSRPQSQLRMVDDGANELQPASATNKSASD